MKNFPLFAICLFLLVACDESGKDEVYNENNTNVSGGVVYNIDEEPINGIYKVYYPDGNVKMEMQSKGGKPDGVGKFYTPEGNLSLQGNFVDGQPDGVFYNYYPSGQVHNEINYAKGVKNGIQKIYDKEGSLQAEVIFENGEPTSGYALINGEKTDFSAEELAEMK